MACGTGAILIDSPNGPTKTGRVLEGSCNSWGCPSCARRKAQGIRARLMAALESVWAREAAWLASQGLPPKLAWRVFKFISFTVDIKHFISPERYRSRDWKARPEEALAALQKMMRAWNTMHAWLTWRRGKTLCGRRAPWEGTGRRIQYFGVVEFTKNGWPHLHIVILWREKLSKEDLAAIRRLWDKYGIGKSVKLKNKNFRRRDPRRIASYLSKYLSKDLPAKTLQGRFRRFFCSRKFLPPRERRRGDGEAGWSNASVPWHRAEREKAGAEIKDIRGGFEWSSEGVPVPLDPLEGDIAVSLSRMIGGSSPPDKTYRHQGLDFQSRLRTLPERSAATPDGKHLLIPESIERGVRARRARGARRVGQTQQ
jgi:hypothetical protein